MTARAMNEAVENVYGAARRDGTQKALLDTAQMREDLDTSIGYHAHEPKLDALFSKQRPAR